jgi:hypothetical protein
VLDIGDNNGSSIPSELGLLVNLEQLLLKKFLTGFLPVFEGQKTESQLQKIEGRFWGNLP